MKPQYILAFIAAGIGLSGCTDSLSENPASYYEREDIYTDASKASMAVMGIYNELCVIYADKDGMATPCSDDTYYISGVTSDNGQRDLAHYLLRNTNSVISAVWAGKYTIIDRANAVISGIEGMRGWQNDATLRHLMGEARFLRAQSAFDLVRYWGDVPFKTVRTDGYEIAYGPRVPREDIYRQIIADLDYAKEAMPWADETGTPERASQGAARALLMRVYLTRAGYSLQADGQLRRPSEQVRRQCFEAVAAEWQSFENKGYHTFYPLGYAELFKGFSAGTPDTRESLFEIAFLDLKTNGVWGTRNGPAVAAPGISPTESGNFMGRANAMYRAVPDWRGFFEDTDERRDVMVCTYSYKWDVNVYNHIKTEQKNPVNWYPGKWRREWMPLGYTDPNKTSTNYCLLRYGDVVLMAAEAYAELGEYATAWELINRVRSRAGASAVDATTYATVYKAPRVFDLPFIPDGDEAGRLRTALYWERGFELAFEGQRRFDLIRWGILAEALTLFHDKGDQRLHNPTERYPAALNFIKGKHELFPIPLDELQVNPKLENKNNPGY